MSTSKPTINELMSQLKAKRECNNDSRLDLIDKQGASSPQIRTSTVAILAQADASYSKANEILAACAKKMNGSNQAANSQTAQQSNTASQVPEQAKTIEDQLNYLTSKAPTTFKKPKTMKDQLSDIKGMPDQTFKKSSTPSI